jgi:hypothetical protein
MTKPTQPQVLTVENPLGLYDGCYARQRDGAITGPWVWESHKSYGSGWYLKNLEDGATSHRCNTGRFYLDSENYLDLIQVASSPKYLPEPIERYYNIYSHLKGCYEHSTRNSAIRACGRDGKTYRARIEFLEQVKP